MSGTSGGMGVLTTLTEGVSVAFDALRANKIRSALTILGITIGVLVVMVMAAVVTGINQSFTDAIASRGITTFYVAHYDFTTLDVSGPLDEDESEFMTNPPLDPRWARDLGRLPGIQSAHATVDLSGSNYQATWGSQTVDISLFGVGSDFLELDSGDIIDGRFFSAFEEERRDNVAVIDSAMAQDLFGGLDPLGRRFRITRGTREAATFEVIGIYRPPANLFAGFATHYVWLPFATADKELNVWDRMVAFVVRPEPELQLADALDLVHTRMRQLRRLTPGEENNFALMTQDQFVDLWGQLTTVLFAVMIALSGVGLMVGGVGVIGIMMISVTERTREIGLRKSMGARRRDILWQFLVEAASLTLLGGLIGLAIGGGLVWLVANFSPLPATVPLWAIGVAIAASALTGVGFGLYPASRAARLDPIEALRYE